MALEDLIRGGALYPNRNLDMTLQAEVDLSDYQYTAALITGAGKAYYYTGVGNPIIGIIQSKTGMGELAVIRYAGVSRIRISEDVYTSEMLVLDSTGTAKIYREGGHTHIETSPPSESVLVLARDPVSPVTGLTIDDFILSHTYWDVDGSIVEDNSLNFVTEATSGGGWYQVGIEGIAGTAPRGDIPHRLEIGLTHGGWTVAPGEHSWMQHRYFGGNAPQYADVVYLLGQALESGVTGDSILVQLQMQVF